MQLIVRKVKTAQDSKVFNQFTRDLYANDSIFVSHIDQDINAIFNPSKNSEFEYGDAIRWLVYNENRVVGKVAAFFNTNTKQAGIGFFDCINNQKVASLLFSTAEDWLKENGQSRIEAPVNFGERDKYWGLLVEGFTDPAYQENYNFPYYQELFESAGYKKTIEQTTSEALPTDIDYDKYKRFTERLETKSELNARHLILSQLSKFVGDFVDIYNEAWKQHEHFVPMTVDRVTKLFTDMKPIIRENLLWFLYDGEEPVGFYLSIIDLNQVLKHVNGNMNWWGKLKFVYYLKKTKIDSIRGVIFGVKPKYQNKGVYSILIMKMYEVMMKDQYIKSTELAWIGDFNPRMHALFDSLNAKRKKLHYTYQKVL